MGVEGGHAIENSLEKLDSLYHRGVRYMTLTWNNGNDWAGSATDERRNGGLTDLGKRVVRRMNQLGMLVDVSHASDSTFWDVLATTSRPVIASHSSCRAIARHPRNLSDEQLRALAKNGGVVGINFYPVFLDDHFREQYEELRRRLRPETDSIHARYRGRPGESAFEIDKFVGAQAERLGVPGLDRLVDHIDHAVQVMGIDHVGLGSDFVAAASASSCSWANWDRFWQLEHVTSGFRSCMIANPAPPNGSTRFCAGKASTPTMRRRMSWNATFPGSIVPSGSTMVVWRSDRKNDCSYPTYNAVRLPVTSQCPPNVGSKA